MPQLNGPVGLGPVDDYYHNPEYKQQQLEEEEQKKTQTQQRQKAQGETGPKTVNPLKPIQQALSTDLGEPITGALDTILGTDLQKQYKQTKQETKKIRTKAETAINKDTGVLAETSRVVMNAGVGAVEATLDTFDVVGDAVKVGVNKVIGNKTKATEDPWNDRYTSAAYSFGTQKPKTEIGQAALKLAELVVLTRAVATKAPKALIQLGTKGKGIKGAVASGLVPGAVADFMLTKPEDGNFSTMVRNLVPENHPLHDSVLFALAAEKDDDIFQAKIKGVLEGGAFGAVIDGAGWLLFGRKAAQAALKAGKSESEAMADGLKASEQAMKQMDADNVKAVEAESMRWGEVHQEEMNQLLDLERRYLDQEAAFKEAGIDETDPKFRALQETLGDVRVSMAELDEAIARGYDPDDAKELLPQDAAATIKTGPVEDAIGQQHRSLNNTKAPSGDPTIPKAVRSAPMNVGGSVRMMTDAQFRISNIKGGAEDVIRKLSSRMDLQEAAKAAMTSVDGIVKSAAQELEDFRNALGEPLDNQTIYQMMKEAEVIDPDSVSGRYLSKKGVLVTKALVRDTALQINDLATNAAALREAGEFDGNSFDRVVDRLVFLLDLHKQTAYRYGSGLNIFKQNVGSVADEAGAEAKAALSMGEIKEWALKVKKLQRSSDPNAAGEMDALIRAMVLAGGDPSKTVRFWDAARGIGFKQAMTNMYQSMLSGPITHLRNMFGNSYAILERPFSTYLRGVIKNDPVLRNSATAGLHSMYKGIQDAWEVAATTLKTGDSVNYNAKFVVEDFETRAILGQLDMAARTDSEKIAVGLLEKSYTMLNNPWFSWPSRALLGADDFFKTLAARYRMNSHSMYLAQIHAADKGDVDFLFKKYIDEYSKGIDPQSGRILDKDLLDYAERVAFQQDPGSFMNAVANAVDQAPFGKLFIPFVRTPANLLGYGLEHVPLINRQMGHFRRTLEAAEKSGDYLLVEELKGREATGAFLVGALLTMATQTDITGNLPFDPNERKAWRVEGRPAMSIRVGNKWVSYASFEPVNSMLSIVADAVRLVKIGGADAAGQVMRQLAYSIMAGYTDKSFLSGLGTLGELINPKTLQDPSALNFLLNSANTMVPYAGVRRAFANSLDPYMKETRNELDRMLIAAAPGYGNELPSVTSWITGKKLHSNAGGLYNALSPVRIYDVENNKLVKTLSEIGYPSNDIIKTGKNGVRLAPEHRERLSQLLFQSGLPKKLEQVIGRKEWQNMAKAYKNRPITAEMIVGANEDNTPPHIKQISGIISKYKTQALNVLYDEDPSYRALVMEKRETNIKALRGDFTKSTIKEDLKQLAEF